MSLDADVSVLILMALTHRHTDTSADSYHRGDPPPSVSGSGSDLSKYVFLHLPRVTLGRAMCNV